MRAGSGSGGSRRRRLVLVVVAAALAAAAIAGLLLALRDPPVRTDGPLVLVSEVAQGSSFPRDRGESVTFATIEVYNAGPEPATLERVSLVDAEPGLLLVGSLAAPRPEGAFVVAYPRFPPRPGDIPPDVAAFPGLGELAGRVLRPQPTATVDTASTTQVYVGLASLVSEGRVVVQSFRIHYRVGDRAYELVVPHAVRICTPRASVTRVKPCPTSLPETS